MKLLQVDNDYRNYCGGEGSVVLTFPADQRAMNGAISDYLGVMATPYKPRRRRIDSMLNNDRFVKGT